MLSDNFEHLEVRGLELASPRAVKSAPDPGCGSLLHDSQAAGTEKGDGERRREPLLMCTSGADKGLRELGGCVPVLCEARDQVLADLVQGAEATLHHLRARLRAGRRDGDTQKVIHVWIHVCIMNVLLMEMYTYSFLYVLLQYLCTCMCTCGMYVYVYVPVKIHMHMYVYM